MCDRVRTSAHSNLLCHFGSCVCHFAGRLHACWFMCQGRCCEEQLLLIGVGRNPGILCTDGPQWTGRISFARLGEYLSHEGRGGDHHQKQLPLTSISFAAAVLNRCTTGMMKPVVLVLSAMLVGLATAGEFVFDASRCNTVSRPRSRLLHESAKPGRITDLASLWPSRQPARGCGIPVVLPRGRPSKAGTVRLIPCTGCRL